MKNTRFRARAAQRTVLLFILSFILAILPAPAQAVGMNRTIRIGCFPLNGFFNIATGGTVTGYGAEYTNAVAAHAGWKYEYVPYSNWVTALEALSKNEIDILAPAQHTAERDKLYTFSSFPIGTEYGSLLTLGTNESLIFEDFSAFNGLNVGCVKSVVFLDDFEKYEARNGFSVHYTYYKDTPALLAALYAKEVDAIVVNMMVKTNSTKLLARFGASPIYYMLSPEASDLREALNQAIDKVSFNHPEFQIDLNNEYFSDFDKIPFSKQEISYITQIGTLHVACGADYAPFSYVDKETEQVDGVDRAILQRISAISGLKFCYHAIPFGEDMPAFIKDNNIALIAGVENVDHTQLHNNNFSNPYISVSKYFVGLKNTNFRPTASMNIAVVSAVDAQISEWKKSYPRFEFVHYACINDCMDAVRRGEADFLLGDRYSMENVLASPKNQDLRILPTEAITSSICFKITLSDSPENTDMFISILNKSIRQIAESDKDMYISSYVQKNRYQYTLSDFIYQYHIQIFCIVLLLVIVILALVFMMRAKRTAQRTIEENEMKLRHITNNIKGGVIVLKTNENLEITFANDGFLQLIGCSRQQFEHSPFASYLTYIHPDDHCLLHTAIQSGKAELSLELRMQKSDGNYIPTLFNCTSGRKSSGEKELYCVILDMTEQNKLLEQLKIENRRTELILDRVDEVFYEINLRSHAIATSKSFLEKLGWTLPNQIPSHEDLFCEMWHTTEENLDKLRNSTEKMFVKKQPVSVMILLESKIQNRYIWCEVLQHPVFGQDGLIVSVIGLIRDVDKQVAERERLIKQAQIDQLTGLYNKEAFEKIVKDTLLTMPEQNHALIFIDLDHFKSVNDTLGHLMGDQAICDAADKLKIIFSNYDILSRFGGDEFCIFVKNIPAETLRRKMRWLVEKLRTTYHNDEKGTVCITCSCGVACTELLGFDYQVLMQNADDALYYSKATGRNRFTFYQDIKNQ